MKICVAQTRPIIGDIQKNIERHIHLTELAATNQADLIIFPELSLTGYEPKLAQKLAISFDDSLLASFQNLSEARAITIGVGMPIRSENGIKIGMVIFHPDKSRSLYCKQKLHSDELPYFVEGYQEVILNIKGHKVAPAICYESLLPEHSDKAFNNGAKFYVASVVKSVRGLEKAAKHYSETAKKFSMPVLMSNSVGPCDDFVSGGKTSVWNQEGLQMAELNDNCEGILIYDTLTQEVLKLLI